MTDLAPDGHVVTGVPEQIRHMGPTGILDLVKAFDLVVMGVEAGKHDVAARHAIAHRYVSVVEPDGLGSQTVHPGARPLELASVHPHRVTTHVVDGNQKEIRLGWRLGKKT